jgi:molecular chaperone DnaK (HSP70)
MSARFSLGIDLGTSNSAIAIADLESGETRIIEIEQIVGPNQVGEMPTLPIPHNEELPASSFPLPWNEAGGRAIIGQFARDRGALVPDRLASSAKSWLSNPHIDPKQRILPWRSDIAEEKLSPFECSRLYLQHLRDGFLHAERAQGRDWDLSEGEIVVTVPASFDEVARSLTAEAADAAGLGDVIRSRRRHSMPGRRRRAENGAT